MQQIDLDYRQLGRSDLKVSVIGLGGNVFVGPPRLDLKQSQRVIQSAAELGVNCIDTAPAYGEGASERFIGTALRGNRKHEFVIATKFSLRGVTSPEEARARVREQLEQSLRNLQRDYVDLLQIHFPQSVLEPAELLLTLDRLVGEGKVRAIGCCNFAGWRMAEFEHVGRTLGTARFCAVQDYYNLFARQAAVEVVPACQRFQLSLIPYHPLGGGFLTGKYREGEPPPAGTRGATGSPIVRRLSRDRNWERMSRLEAFAGERGVGVGTLAIAWLAGQGVVGSIIAGASDPEQVQQNVQAARLRLDADELKMLDDIVQWGVADDILSPEVGPSPGIRSQVVDTPAPPG